MLSALYAYFLERGRATELHDSQYDSHTGGLTATTTDEGGRKVLKPNLARTAVDGHAPPDAN